MLHMLFLQEKIDDLMLKNSETAWDISPNNSVGVIFGKEHPGRVRGLLVGVIYMLFFFIFRTRSGFEQFSKL